MSHPPAKVRSVCVYCGSANTANPDYIHAAAILGEQLAAAKLRLVYGGGGTGLMGAVARGAHGAGGDVLGVMPEFLRQPEALFEDVKTVVVETMHERKMILFEESDAFVVLPGGIGTLEEIVELMSWRRLELHRKPIVFFSPDGFWEPLFVLLRHTIEQKLTPPLLMDTWRTVETVDEIVPAIQALALVEGPHIGLRLRATA
jgi:uncharacterized protein (TIGR00730 family)